MAPKPRSWWPRLSSATRGAPGSGKRGAMSGSPTCFTAPRRAFPTIAKSGREDVAPALMPAYLDAIKRYRIKYLLGYSSALHELALGALDAGRTDLKMDVVITNAEPLFANQREAIRSAFQCDVRETYGMAEIVSAA